MNYEILELDELELFQQALAGTELDELDDEGV